MGLKVLCKLGDALAQERNLHLWRTTIVLIDPVLRNDVRLGLNCQGHGVAVDTP
jgi:hypothetical protein